MFIIHGKLNQRRIKMKQIIIAIVIITITIGTALAGECDIQCTWELLNIDLTLEHKSRLAGGDGYIYMPDEIYYYEKYAPEDIPMIFKVIDFNRVTNGRYFQIVSGSIEYSYMVQIIIKNCSEMVK